MSYTTLWQFQTGRFDIILDVAPEEMDPADSFEFDDDIDAVRNGEVDWFFARCRVLFDGEEVGDDTLGGCAYKSASDFVTEHRDPNPMARNCTIYRAANGENAVILHYFPDMVRIAIGRARAHLHRCRDIYLRA